MGYSNVYGCQCQSEDVIIEIIYVAKNKIVNFYKNGVNCEIILLMLKII